MDIINLNDVALEIARKRLLENLSYKELARRYYTSPSTIHRRLTAWLKEGRFELQDRLAAPQSAVITGKDDILASQLVRRFSIWRARVVQISGAEGAYTDHYQESPESPAAQAAFKAGDELHRCLGETAAEIILAGLRKNMTLGIASGRGVGFTIEAIGQTVKQSPAWVSGYAGIRLVSLCGGVHVGQWSPGNFSARDFDADANVFALAAALKIPRRNITYVTGPVPAYPSASTAESVHGLDLDIALIGLGQLNTRSHYFRNLDQLQMDVRSEAIRQIIDWQAKNPEFYDNLAEIAMKLYPTGHAPLPAGFLQAIKEMNDTILSISPLKIREAAEVILVAGGHQKLAALRGLLNGDYPGAPIDRKNLTLITDSWTAERILEQS
jgi:DNA-binding transcriptional regulator LsrR (DeoR family)